MRSLFRRVALTAAVVSWLGSGCRDGKRLPEPPASVGTMRNALARPPTDTVGDLFGGQVLATARGVNLVDAAGVNLVMGPGNNAVPIGGMALDLSVSPARLYVADAANHRVLLWLKADAFANGQPADMVIGQPSFHATTPADLDAPNGNVTRCVGPVSASTLCLPRGVAVDDSGNLYVADSLNNRVLEFDSPATTDLVADRVIGQARFDLNGNNAGRQVADDTLFHPRGVAVDAGGRLFVADAKNHRVLRFEPPLAAYGTKAKAVFGQGLMRINEANLRVDARSINGALSVAVDRSSNRLYVSDTQNHRILGWPDASSFKNGDPATIVLGQPDPYSNSFNVGAGTLKLPRGLAVDKSGNLFVADWGNRRVLIYRAPIASYKAADLVLGQPSFTTSGPGNCTPSATTLCDPSDVAVADNGDVAVSDMSKNRVVVFQDPLVSPASPPAGDAVADRVFGQTTFTAELPNAGGNTPSAASLLGPAGVAFDSTGNLYVADYSNNRVLSYNAPLTGMLWDANADLVFGQGSSFQSSTANLGGISANSLHAPTDVAIDDDGNAWIFDSGNSRVLGYNTPRGGRQGFGGIGDAGTDPAAGSSDGTAPLPPPSDVTADKVIGQSGSFTTGAAPPVVPSNADVDRGTGLATDADGNLYVADTIRNRVLGFIAPLATDAIADRVLGQVAFDTSQPNVIDGAGVNLPSAVAVDRGANRLYVADTDNHRVLAVDRAADFVSGVAANLVFGQFDNFNQVQLAPLPCLSPPSNATLCAPQGVAVNGAGKLYVADTNNHRVLAFDAPTASRQANQVFGQNGNFGNNFRNLRQPNGPPSAASLHFPLGVAPDALGNLFVLDSANHRVLRFEGTADTNADQVLGQSHLHAAAPNSPGGVGFTFPTRIAFDRSRNPTGVYVADTQNNRVLGWLDVKGFQSGAAPNVAIGQPDSSQTFPNNNGRNWPANLKGPRGLAVDSKGRLYVADVGNDRVLIYESPFSKDASADYNLGGQSLGAARDKMRGPIGVALDSSDRLYVADMGHHRVLVFDNPTSGNQNADFVIGWPDFVSPSDTAPKDAYNNFLAPPASATTLANPEGVALDSSGRLYVADRDHHRVVGFSSPRSSGTADLVVGQPNLTTAVPGRSAGSPSNLTTPLDVSLDTLDNLYVVDDGNNRVLRYENPRTKDGSFDQIFGQPNDASFQCNQAGQYFPASAVGLCGPRGVAADPGGTVYVTDARNNRVVVYLNNTLPLASNAVLGPAAPRKGDALTATYAYSDVDGDAETVSEIRWFKGGAVQTAFNDAKLLPVDAIAKGETWSFTVRPNDGLNLGLAVTSSSVTVGNTAPVATSPLIAPAAPRKLDGLTAIWSYSDADGDPQGAPVIRWLKGGMPQAANDDKTSVPSSDLSKGQSWSFTVSPSDGTDKGAVATSQQVTIANSLPLATSLSISPLNPGTGDKLTASYTYADPDGDGEVGTAVRWFRNGNPEPAYNDNPVVAKLGPNEQWYFTVQPGDGTGSGAVVTSATVVVGSSAPTATGLAVNPASPTSSSSLTATYTYTSKDGTKESGSQIAWFKNGVRQAAHDNSKTVPSSALTRGESWSFAVTPSDGVLKGATQTSASVTIGNSSPAASNPAIAPAVLKKSTALTATYSYKDADGDAEKGSTIVWSRNGVPEGKLNDLKGLPAGTSSRGEKWAFTVTPSDGMTKGTAVTSTEVTVSNTAPTASSPIIASKGLTVTTPLMAQFVYADEDSDAQLGSQLRWVKNGTPAQLDDKDTVPTVELKKGQVWSYSVTPRDGTDLGATVTAPAVTILNSPPYLTNLGLTPVAPMTGDKLVLGYTFNDADSDADLGTEIHWFKDGVEETTLAGASTVPAGAVKRGEQWSYSARPKDGTDFGTAATLPPITIGNANPTASKAVVSPGAPTALDTLTATYKFTDPETDAEAGSKLAWFKSGTEQFPLADKPSIPPSELKKGDAWSFTVRPGDGTGLGNTVVSNVVVIANAPPAVAGVTIGTKTGKPPLTDDELLVTYTFKDADGDSEQGTEFRWFRDPMDGTGSKEVPPTVPPTDPRTVPARLIKAKESWVVAVKPKDGVAFGTEVRSAPVIVANAPPQASALTIDPAFPRTEVALTAKYTFADPEKEVEKGSRILWYRNGKPVPTVADKPSVPASETARGESWYFTLEPSDGTSFGLLQSLEKQPVTILNTPPSADNLAIVPAVAKTDTTLKAAYDFKDLDLDAESGSEIEWFRNGQKQASLKGKREVQASATVRGELWNYSVKPSDGSDSGVTAVSPPVFIENSVPKADAGKDQTVTPKSKRTTVKLDGTGSDDLDKDRLTFTWYLEACAKVKDATPALASGPTPVVELDVGKHTICLAVTDNVVSPPSIDPDTGTDEAIVEIVDPRPTATAGADQTLPPGPVKLGGSGTDSLGRTLTAKWTQVSGDKVVLNGDDTFSPSFFALKAGTREFSLTVSTGSKTPTEWSAAVTTKVTIQNIAPFASFGGRTLVRPGEAAVADGSGSDDANGDVLTFRWTLAAGPSKEGLSEADKPKAKLVLASEGRYQVQLVVNDGALDSAPSAGEVLVVDPAKKDHRPYADAGPDGTGEIGAPVTLDGKRSFDVDGDPLVFTWRRVDGPGPSELKPVASVRPSFTPTAAGDYVFALVVSDGKQTSEEDQVAVKVLDTKANRWPVARAGSDVAGKVGAELTLDGSRSADPDGDQLTYSWTQTYGPAVSVVGADGARPRFVPTRPGILRFKLVVKDREVTSLPSSVTAQITSGGNRAPVAKAGDDVSVLLGTPVELNGSGSTDEDGDALSFRWEQVEGTPTVLSDAQSPRPKLTPQGVGSYVFRLAVADKEVSSRDEVVVRVKTHGDDDQKPVAVIAGGDRIMKVEEPVLLDGSGSFDPDPLDRLRFRWTVTGFPTGKEPVLAEATTSTPSFVPKDAGDYTVRLVVSDGELDSAAAYVNIAVGSGEGAVTARGCGCGTTAGAGDVLPVLVLALGRLRGVLRRPARKIDRSRECA